MKRKRIGKDNSGVAFTLYDDNTMSIEECLTGEIAPLTCLTPTETKELQKFLNENILK